MAIEYTDNLRQGTDKINASFALTLNKGVSPSNGLYPTGSLYQIPGFFNQSVPPIEVFHYGLLGSPTGTELDRAVLPKGIVAINLSMNIVNNWQWDNVQGRAEPFDTDFPMVAIENGGEGVLCHYTPPGGVPATSFHEITRFGGGVDGLSGVSPYTTYVPLSQFKTTIYACYSSTTTPPAGTDEAWWGGTGNTLSGVLNPLLWLNTEEVKGSGYNLNELARFSAYNTTAYPAINFESSNGTYQTKTAISTNKITGRIGSTTYDGTAMQNTAAILFASRGTISSGNAGQTIAFQTSATNTAGIATRMEVTYDGIVKTLVPVRLVLASVTGVPSYSAATSISPVMDGSTLYSLQASSTTSGGVNLVGFTNVTAGAFPFVFRGVHGHTAPTTPTIILSGSKHNGTTNWTDLAAAEIILQIRNNATVLSEVLGNGNAGFLQTTPTAVVDLAAVTTSRASLRVREGSTTTSPSSPNSGDVWHQGTNNRLMFRKGASSQEVMCSVQVNSVTPTVPDRTIQITIDGTTYYIHAKTTND